MQQQHPPNAPPPASQSILDQTLKAIQERVMFFSSEGFSAENYLQPSQSLSIRSISDIITSLKIFAINETPLSMALSGIYANDDNKGSLKWNIPPASEGEDSINEDEVFEPSFRWLYSAFVDPNLLTLDQPQAVKIEKHRIPEEWQPVTSLLFFNVSKKIHLKSQIIALESNIRRKFCERYYWLRFKRIKEIFYRGKPCIMLKFADPSSAAFVYFHYASQKFNRDEFGDQCELFRVVKDDTKEYQKQKNWILLFFRHLPISMTKQQLMSIINVTGCVKWMQELIEIEGAKYTCCKVSYLDEALHVCELFNARKIKDAKVNIHPKSSKNWKSQQAIQQQIIEEHPTIQNPSNIDINQSY